MVPIGRYKDGRYKLSIVQVLSPLPKERLEGLVSSELPVP